MMTFSVTQVTHEKVEELIKNVNIFGFPLPNISYLLKKIKNCLSNFFYLYKSSTIKILKNSKKLLKLLRYIYMLSNLSNFKNLVPNFLKEDQECL